MTDRVRQWQDANRKAGTQVAIAQADTRLVSVQGEGSTLWAGFPPRIVILVLLLVLEKLLLLHVPRFWFPSAVHIFGGTPVLFGLVLLFFGRRPLASAGLERPPIRKLFLLAHVLVLAVLATLQRYFRLFGAQRGTPQFHLASLAWPVLVVIAVLTLTSALIPARRMWRIGQSLGWAWVFAGGCALGLILLRHFADLSWDTSSSYLGQRLHEACFGQTRALLQRFYPQVIAVPDRHLLGTPRYLVEISWLCSGIEGLALVLMLLLLWLFFVRHELRLRRAILIIPLALGLTWMMNIVRIALLIAIGDAGHPRMAGTGFHAQAGWISLNLLVLGCLLIVQRVPWFRLPDPSPAGDAAAHVPGVALAVAPNLPAVYLLPFAAILASSLITQALSSGFEWLYPLRFVAALAALWAFRRHYRAMDWRFGAPGLLAGAAVGCMWVGLRHVIKDPGSSAVDTVIGLAGLPYPARLAWISIRVLAAVTTVPLAEELAFRGFLARRLVAADFASIPYRRLSLLAIAISSAAFGAMHGRVWAGGIVAGLIFAFVAKRANRLGEAVAAHAVANLLIAVVAVLRHDYSLW